uniref:2,3-bisphosphoglycerate-independent phosphoglycerate mutase n=1 Tax=Sporolithon durum TaxID=48970 RepID=A0A141SCY4_9FLOR|nr:phosphoglycerate mutase [Sporolithon durum]AMK96152.1 phosphoglycerate mutase [Sporolithon durum]
MSQQTICPIILTILDGWGYCNSIKGNAIKSAKTPTMDILWKRYPNTLLEASGEKVGLPQKQMGNSEVGHMIIGAGRTIDQELVKISKNIKKKDFFYNKLLNKVYTNTGKQQKKLHIIGLCSNGGVHSHIDHLFALIKMGKKYTNLEICIHVITDGRDTEPKNTQRFIEEILLHTKDSSKINICTISGRFYSMDRDCRWSRIEKTYLTLINNSIKLKNFNNPLYVIKENYRKQIYDEFIPPTRIKEGKIENDDSIIFFNFRPDRIRQLVQSFSKTKFKGFNRKNIERLNITTFTNYDSTLDLPIVFPKEKTENFLAKIISEHSLKQFRIAETEKYAHITYFLNGGTEEPFPGEDREFVLSPRVDNYEATPEMSAKEITNSLIKAINKNIYKVLIVNYANPDMIGHTGNFNATLKAIESVDNCLQKLVNKIKEVKGTLIITADHGNAEQMLDNYNQPCKSHTLNPVPFILINAQMNLKNEIDLNQNGSLADIAPTILDLLQIRPPKEMEGKSLICKKKYN